MPARVPGGSPASVWPLQGEPLGEGLGCTTPLAKGDGANREGSVPGADAVAGDGGKREGAESRGVAEGAVAYAVDERLALAALLAVVLPQRWHVR